MFRALGDPPAEVLKSRKVLLPAIGSVGLALTAARHGSPTRRIVGAINAAALAFTAYASYRDGVTMVDTDLPEIGASVSLAAGILYLAWPFFTKKKKRR